MFGFARAFNREIELKNRFNIFIADKITGIDEDYYSRLTVRNSEDIKTTLKGIHNIITYKTTIYFLDLLSGRIPYVKENYKFYLDSVSKIKPSDNGYDFTILGDICIVAEI